MANVRSHFLDASAIAKLFLAEDGSDKMRSYFSQHAVWFTTSICFAEALGVLKTKWKYNHITQEHYLGACEELMAYLRGHTLEIDDLRISERDVFDGMEILAKKYSLDIADAYQLLTLKTGILSVFAGSKPILITADGDLAAAARTEGLSAWDCLREPAPPLCAAE